MPETNTTKKTKTSPDFNTLVLDIGNSEIKGLVNGELVILPSNYDSWCGKDDLQLKGIRAPFDGFTVMDYQNNPLEVQYKFSPLGGKNLLGDGDKLLLYRNIIQGCCAGDFPAKPWKVVVSYWDQRKLHLLPEKIEGSHTVLINGLDRQFEIDTLVPVAEGSGAHALYRKKFSGTFVSVDIGYDTVIFRSSSPAGVLNHSARQNTGVKQIVSFILNSPALSKIAGQGVTDRTVIDAIKNGGILRNNSQQVPDVDISSLIAEATKYWFQGSFLKIVQEYKEDVTQASGIWLVGGGANLLKDFTANTNICVPDSPGYVNLHGMATLLP